MKTFIKHITKACVVWSYLSTRLLPQLVGPDLPFEPQSGDRGSRSRGLAGIQRVSLFPLVLVNWEGVNVG